MAVKIEVRVVNLIPKAVPRSFDSDFNLIDNTLRSLNESHYNQIVYAR